MSPKPTVVVCPKCGENDQSMIERVPAQTPTYYCNTCGKEFRVQHVKPQM